MKFQLRIKDEAQTNILRNAVWWSDHHSHLKAEEWIYAVYQQIDDLVSMPERHGLARENVEFPFDLRQKLVGLGPRPSYRVLFRIVGNYVEVLTFLAAEEDDWTAEVFP